MYDAIILSDLHLGSDLCQTKRLEKFIANLPNTTRLILNGDILENSEIRLKKHHWSILSQLRKISDQLELTWVAGNHDYDAGAIAHLLGAKFVSDYIFQSGDKHILCAHGDRWDEFISNHWLLTHIADFFYSRALKYVPDLAALAKRNSKHFIRCCDKVRSGALAYANKCNVDIICCGHTHQVEENHGYYNSGCWTESRCSYLMVKDGMVILQD